MAENLTARGRLSPWLVFYLGVCGAWAALYAMQAPPLPAGAAAYAAALWRALCVVEPGLAGYPTVLAMWALMVAAMMAPGVVPALATYRRIDRAAPFWALLAGYGAVWLGFAVLAAALQLALASAALATPDGRSLSPWLTAALLLLAGGYQFSPLKDACLSRCRAPFAFFLAQWRDGHRGAAAMGLRLGADCLGCCWALMLLAFVGGAMNLAFMGLATILMTAEKLPRLGRPLNRPLGVTLVLAGAFTLGTTI